VRAESAQAELARAGHRAALDIRQVAYESPVAQRLITAAEAELVDRDGSGDASPIDAAEFRPPAGAFFVAFLGGEPVGCAGWRSYGADAAELKRMYTAPAARRRGVGRQLLAAVERSAREHGRTRVVLVTGDKQPEAIAMYRTCGYQPIENFGYYRDSPGCRSFARAL
jgi:GNAT superfamily N-acetyltransferase